MVYDKPLAEVSLLDDTVSSSWESAIDPFGGD